jgi:hypothetical protein
MMWIAKQTRHCMFAKRAKHTILAKIVCLYLTGPRKNNNNLHAVPTNYSISSSKMTWTNARNACLSQGMDIASLETVAEHECVKDKLYLAGKFA